MSYLRGAPCWQLSEKFLDKLLFWNEVSNLLGFWKNIIFSSPFYFLI